MGDTYMWRKPDGKSRPEARKQIILLTEDNRVMRGYMNATVWPNETRMTYSFHGEYYDLTNQRLVYCLVNCAAWMPLPDMPKLLSQIAEQRAAEIERSQHDTIPKED